MKRQITISGEDFDKLQEESKLWYKYRNTNSVILNITKINNIDMGHHYKIIDDLAGVDVQNLSSPDISERLKDEFRYLKEFVGDINKEAKDKNKARRELELSQKENDALKQELNKIPDWIKKIYGVK